MVGIKEYHVLIGSYNRSVEDIATGCSIDELKEMKRIGLKQIPTDNERLLMSMILEVIETFCERFDLIIIAHSLPYICNNESKKNFIDRIPVLYLSGLPCTVMHKAVELAKKMIEAKHYERILVIGADKAYSDRERKFFGTIMGDAVVGILLSENDSDLFIENHVQTHIYASDGENSTPNNISAFRLSNVTNVRSCIMKCIEKAFLKVSDISYIVPHTSNCTFWDAVSELSKIERKKFLTSNMRRTGHFNSHDSFYHYFKYCEDKTIKKGNYVLLVNPGFGGTQACTIIRH